MGFIRLRAVCHSVSGKFCIPKAHFIGHSFGGRISIILSAEHPEKVDKLILVDSAGIRPQRTANTISGRDSKSRQIDPPMWKIWRAPCQRNVCAPRF